MQVTWRGHRAARAARAARASAPGRPHARRRRRRLGLPAPTGPGRGGGGDRWGGRGGRAGAGTRVPPAKPLPAARDPPRGPHSPPRTGRRGPAARGPGRSAGPPRAGAARRRRGRPRPGPRPRPPPPPCPPSPTARAQSATRACGRRPAGIALVSARPPPPPAGPDLLEGVRQPTARRRASSSRQALRREREGRRHGDAHRTCWSGSVPDAPRPDQQPGAGADPPPAGRWTSEVAEAAAVWRGL